MSEFYFLSRHIRKAEIENRAPSFCNCPLNTKNGDINNSGIVTCECGEDVTDCLEWNWDRDSAQIETHISGKNVVFHPVYSQGTSVVRGDTVLKKNLHHYWEIKVTRGLYGTDTMIGVGTDKLDMESHRYRFASVLGLNSQSWGYSYRGLIQHCGKLKYYGKKYTQGCIVGVHLDLCKGSIEFYLNRRSQGKAFINIPVNDANLNFYPMACSTSAKATIKLLNAFSFNETLQYNCIRIITKYPSLIEKLNKMPGLFKLARQYWFLYSPDINNYLSQLNNNSGNKNSNSNELTLSDDAIVSGLKKYKKFKFSTSLDEDDSNGNVVEGEGNGHASTSDAEHCNGHGKIIDATSHLTASDILYNDLYKNDLNCDILSSDSTTSSDTTASSSLSSSFCPTDSDNDEQFLNLAFYCDH